MMKAVQPVDGFVPSTVFLDADHIVVVCASSKKLAIINFFTQAIVNEIIVPSSVNLVYSTLKVLTLADGRKQIYLTAANNIIIYDQNLVLLKLIKLKHVYYWNSLIISPYHIIYYDREQQQLKTYNPWCNTENILLTEQASHPVCCHSYEAGNKIYFLGVNAADQPCLNIKDLDTAPNHIQKTVSLPYLQGLRVSKMACDGNLLVFVTEQSKVVNIEYDEHTQYKSKILIVDIRTYNQIKIFEGIAGKVLWCQFSMDSNYLYVATDSSKKSLMAYGLKPTVVSVAFEDNMHLQAIGNPMIYPAFTMDSVDNKLVYPCRGNLGQWVIVCNSFETSYVVPSLFDSAKATIRREWDCSRENIGTLDLNPSVAKHVVIN